MNYDLITVTLNPSLDREIIIDDFEMDKLFRINNPSNSMMDPGGKGLNVSVMLSTLNVKSVAMGFLGGYIGKVVQSKLGYVKNITTNFVYTSEETRENIAMVDPTKNTITEINSLGPFVTEEDYDHFLKRYKSSLSLVDHVLISGSIPPGVPISAYSELFGLAKEAGKITYMEAIGPHFDEAIKKNCPMIVKPDLRRNQRILGVNLEKVDDYIYIGKKIIEYGAKLVVFSYHIAGDIIITENGVWVFTSKENIEKSHLFGTGSAFLSGIVHYLMKNKDESEKDFFEAAKYGMSSAISSASYIGKILGSEEEINLDMNKFEVERIE